MAWLEADGLGFDPRHHPLDETHVGLRIMAERAQRIDAALEVISTPQHGCSIILSLPTPAHPMPPQGAPPAPVTTTQAQV